MKEVVLNQEAIERSYHLGLAEVPSSPRILAIETTANCNIDCIFCPRGEPNVMTRPVGRMSDATFARVVEQARYFMEPVLLHLFGEPLLDPQLCARAALLKTKAPRVGVSTNATLLNESWTLQLLESPLDELYVALDGHTKEVYECTRKSKTFTFERVRANVLQFLAAKRARGAGPKVLLQMIMTEDCAAQRQEYLTFWQEAGADEVYFKELCDWGGQMPELHQLIPLDVPLHSPRTNPCKVLWESVVIAWDGRVLACCLDYNAELTLGNLNEQALDDIWNSPRARGLRANEAAGCSRELPCRNCTAAPGEPRRPERYV